MCKQFGEKRAIKDFLKYVKHVKNCELDFFQNVSDSG